MKILEFKIGKMHCMGCALGLENVLEKIEWVKQAEVNFETKMARLECEDENLDLQEIEKAVLEEEFTIEGKIAIK